MAHAQGPAEPKEEGEQQHPPSGPPVSERGKEGLEPNSKRLSQTLSDEPNTRTVGCEMDGRTEIESGRLDLRSDGCKGGPIGPLLGTARSESDGDTRRPHDLDLTAGV